MAIFNCTPHDIDVYLEQSFVGLEQKNPTTWVAGSVPEGEIEAALILRFNPPLNNIPRSWTNEAGTKTPQRYESITLSLSPKHKASLERKALAAGFTWGEDGKPNVSAWLRAIAENECPEPAPRRSDNHQEQIAKVKRITARLLSAVNSLE